MFGTRSAEFGEYTITVDDKVIVESTANNSQIKENQLLGEAKGLDNGTHVAVLRNTGTNSTINLDRFLVQYNVPG